MDFDQEQIRQQFDRLPRELKQAISDADMEGVTENLRAKYGLHIDQLDRLATEITLAMIGLAPMSDFQDRLIKNVGVAEDVANLITYDLNQQLFAKIRQALRQSSKIPQTETNYSEPENQTPEKQEEENAPNNSPQKSQEIFDQKMRGLSGLPKQTVEVDTKKSDNEVDQAKQNPITARDPYRESI